MDKLGLATSELAVNLVDTSRFESALQNLVPGFAASTKTKAGLALLKKLAASDHAAPAGRLDSTSAHDSEEQIDIYIP